MAKTATLTASRCGLCSTAAETAAGRPSSLTAEQWARKCPSRHGKPHLCGDPYPIAEPLADVIAIRPAVDTVGTLVDALDEAVRDARAAADIGQEAKNRADKYGRWLATIWRADLPAFDRFTLQRARDILAGHDGGLWAQVPLGILQGLVDIAERCAS